MSPFQVRPLGCRNNLIAFEIAAGVGLNDRQRDIREAFTLWDAQGRPHKAYPEIPISRPLTGRDYRRLQKESWEQRVAATRRLFGTVPLAGVPRPDLPLRGLIVFHVEIFDRTGGRWTLAFDDGPRWYFTPQQLQMGTTHALPPAHGLQE